METIEQLDIELFFAINSRHSNFFDYVFYYISESWTWIPLYALFFGILVKVNGFKTAIFQILLVGLAVILADLISVYGFKYTIARFRPTHNLDYGSQVHHVFDYKGGIYSFVSSHATNFSAWCFLVYQYLKKIKSGYWLMIFAIIPLLVGYSRIYMGVHYPLDVLGGLMLGTTVSAILYFAVRDRIPELKLQKLTGN